MNAPDTIAKLKGTEPAPQWHWKQNKVYWPYTIQTSDLIERAYSRWKKDNKAAVVTFGCMKVDFNRMCSWIFSKGSKEKSIMRATWFFKDGVWKPFEYEIAKLLEDTLQSGNFTRVEVSSKPLRYVMYAKNEFRQFRFSKGASPNGRPVQRGYNGQLSTEGRKAPIESMIPTVAISPPEIAKHSLSKSILQKIRDYAPTEVDRTYPPLNKGSYGIIYTGKVKDIQETVVIKDILLKDSSKSIEEWRIEVTHLTNAHCPYITAIHGFSVTDSVLSIVMEFVSRGDLYSIIHKGKVHFPPFQRFTFALQICLGIAHLHKISILHRDIKTMNILLTREGTCKLTDKLVEILSVLKKMADDSLESIELNFAAIREVAMIKKEIIPHYTGLISSPRNEFSESFPKDKKVLSNTKNDHSDSSTKDKKVPLIPISTKNESDSLPTDKKVPLIPISTKNEHFDSSAKDKKGPLISPRAIVDRFDMLALPKVGRGLAKSTEIPNNIKKGPPTVNKRKSSIEKIQGKMIVTGEGDKKQEEWNVEVPKDEYEKMAELERLLTWWSAQIELSKENKEETESMWNELFVIEEESPDAFFNS